MSKLVPTQAKSKVTVSVDGVFLGAFITKEGGGKDSEDLRIRPGGGEDEVSLGTSSTFSNITVTKLYDGFMKSKRLWLFDRAGSGRMDVVDQPLDEDDNAFGPPDTYTGGFKRFTPPPRDANGNEAAMCELEMTTDGAG